MDIEMIASLGLASGETLLEVSRRLGHSSITITADVYSHVEPATVRRSAERLDRLIHPDRDPDGKHHSAGTQTPEPR